MNEWKQGKQEGTPILDTKNLKDTKMKKNKQTKKQQQKTKENNVSNKKK